MSEMICNVPEVFSSLNMDMFEEGQSMTNGNVFAASWSCCETDAKSDNSQTPNQMSEKCQPYQRRKNVHSTYFPDDKASDPSNDGIDGLTSEFQQAINCDNETSSQTSLLLETSYPPSEVLCIPESDSTPPGAQFKQTIDDLESTIATNEQTVVQLVISTPSLVENLHSGQLEGTQVDEKSDPIMQQNPEQKEDLIFKDDVSESSQFLQKVSNADSSDHETDVLGLPPLPPGICISPVFEDSGNAGQTDNSSIDASQVSVDDQEEQEVHDQELKTSENHSIKQKHKAWHSSQLVIHHCAPLALKFKVKSAIPDSILHTVVQTCQSSQNFPELKSQIKKLKLKVVQIARSVRQVVVQSSAILEILESFENVEDLVYGYHILSQTLVRNCKGRNEDGIYSVALVIRNISTRHPLLLRLIISSLHKSSPLTVPMYWSHDEDSAEAVVEYQKCMSYARTSEEDSEDEVESETSYLNTHGSLVRLYAALLVAAPRDEVFGVEAAWQYLSRLLNALPPSRTTATALYAFLEFAGNRLYSAYGRQFVKILIFVQNRFLSEMRREAVDEASAISRLTTYISSEQYRDIPGCLELPKDEESRTLRA